MSAILILLAGALWAAILYFTAYVFTFFIPKKWIRIVIGFIAVISLFSLPMWDEIKGAEEFESLCKTGGVYQISPNAVGKKFDLKSSYSNDKELLGYSIPIRETVVSYTDVATNEVVATAKTYRTHGGWISREILGGWGPWIGRSDCSPSTEEYRHLLAITKQFIH